jgi:hypothetical protein
MEAGGKGRRSEISFGYTSPRTGPAEEQHRPSFLATWTRHSRPGSRHTGATLVARASSHAAQIAYSTSAALCPHGHRDGSLADGEEGRGGSERECEGVFVPVILTARITHIARH